MRKKSDLALQKVMQSEALLNTKKFSCHEIVHQVKMTQTNDKDETMPAI